MPLTPPDNTRSTLAGHPEATQLRVTGQSPQLAGFQELQRAHFESGSPTLLRSETALADRQARAQTDNAILARRERAEALSPKAAADVISIFSRHAAVASAPLGWRETIEAEFREALMAAGPKPSDRARATMNELLRLCTGLLPLPEATIELDENGNVELFMRDRSNGLLIVIREDTMMIFGDALGEPWRARYQLEGDVWKRHVGTFLRVFKDAVAAASKRA
jgi:hypothetical protein